ncbi:GPO family capsid scaffolding protein [Sphingomonas sp.]|jgi:hypothetical protein|uniref:GPO family capsid scaffolding protein n=1 Tax=Sphingomonas sp. TaxID=28214 RepID=UPI002E10124C|nr:GPO family capsid scaffolding protein [Sphingomonas sp.]HEV7287743.1 GPO family capsid scaffolding protein [Sphingomonas sp.]
MATKSKFFRAFVEGQTISDGRNVTAEMIDQAVETFNAATYTPGINIEHLSGFSPNPPFNRYGDICAVKAQTDDVVIAGKSEKRRALYAQVDALDQLVELAKSGQKPFPSVELTADYAGTGKVGLVGLAFTDNPASIATEKLAFSRSATVHRTIYSTGTEGVAIEFDAKAADATGITDAITNGLTGFFAKFRTEPAKEEPAPPANDNFDAQAFATAFAATVGEQIAAAMKPVTETVAGIQTEFADIKAKLEKSPDSSFARGPATGASPNAQFVTDC